MKTILAQLMLLFNFILGTFKKVREAMPEATPRERRSMWVFCLMLCGGVMYALCWLVHNTPVAFKYLIGG